ncbi:MAG: RNA polymerase sigma-70 factor [Cytophagales bacterium]|nr:RNA polymerase sigma-70 factor [Cytophagales bacterium]
MYKKDAGLSDQILLNMIRKKDLSAFRQLFDKYWSDLYIYAFNILKVRDVCEDIVQEVFTDLWQKTTGQPIDNPRAYLYKSVKYKVLNQIRNNKIHRKHLDRLKISYAINTLEEEIDFNELDALLQKAIKKLPDGCRQIFEMSRIQCLTNREIADKLNISVQTVKNQISKALKHLRNAVESSFLLSFLFLY